MYDYLVVGAGLFGAVFAHEAKKAGKKVLVIDKREHVAGNIYTKEVDGIQVHEYGAHIFHTSNKEVWDYIQQFAEFNRYTNSPIAKYKDELYNMPFNMNTFSKMWGVTTPQEAKQKIEEQIKEAGITEPHNLEEQAISLVGRDIYEKLVKGYTEKQWGRRATELPAFIIKRLPVRFTFNNNYFNDTYSGIPMEGYTKTIENRLEGVDVRLNKDFLADKDNLEKLAKHVIYTGPIDAYFNYRLGHLEYRTLKFETEKLDQEYYQKAAVVNYTDKDVPYTRICEHKHFRDRGSKVTYITKEYPKEFEEGDRPLYPINNEKNKSLSQSYKDLANEVKNVSFAGRLGNYSYFDRDDTIIEAKKLYQKLTGK